MLIDTTPLAALLIKNDPHHERATEALKKIPPEPLETTLPCITETLYFMREAKGNTSHRLLWQMQENSKLIIINLSELHITRIKALMLQYENFPLSIADAGLLAIAEDENRPDIFTFDQRLGSVQLVNGRFLNIVP